MTDTILVTGISGFLGGHVALALLKAGYRVRGSLRNLDRANAVSTTLGQHGADTSMLEFVSLDLLQDDGWEMAAKDCRYIHHVASPFILNTPKDKDELISPAVGGTERAINAGLKAGAERIVLTSSMAAIMYGHPQGDIFSEEDWSRLDEAGAYVQSKTLAERRAWEMVAASGQRATLATINPSVIYGPLLDNDPGTSGRLIQRLLTGSIPAAPRMVMPAVDVRDVAAAHLAAMTAPEAGGHRHATTAGNISLMETAKALRAAFPAYAGKLPKFEMPDWAVRLYALVDRDARDNLHELGPPREIDNTRIKKLLGRPLTPPADAVTAMGQSLIDQKLV